MLMVYWHSCPAHEVTIMNKVYAELFEIQSKLEPFPKNAQGYNYRYLTLDLLLETLLPLLQEHNLLLHQHVGVPEHEGHVRLTTELIHSSGDSLTYDAEIPIQNPEGISMNLTQAAGAAIKYLRRYSLTALFNVMDGEDDDAATPRVKGSDLIKELVGQYGAENLSAAMAKLDLKVIKSQKDAKALRALLEESHG
jgi:hypothetical protein